MSEALKFKKLLFSFYFVSEAQKYKNSFFFLMILLKFSDFNGFDHISLHNGKYDMMIFFSGFFSGLRIFSGFHCLDLSGPGCSA